MLGRMNKGSAVLGLCVLAVVAALVSTRPAADAATITDVQGVPMEVCDKGENVYSSDVEHWVDADGTLGGASSDDPNRLVLPDGGGVAGATRIEGTISWYLPKPGNPDRAEAVYFVNQLGNDPDFAPAVRGQYVVGSVMACDYRYIKRITGI